MSKRKWVVLATVLLGVALAIVLGWRPLVIRYHHAGMLGAHRAMLTSQPTPRPGWLTALSPALTTGDFYEAYQAHRAALVRLRYFEEWNYSFRRLRVRSEASKSFWRGFQQQFPDIHFTGRGYNPGESASITVWARPEEMPAIQGFVHRHDVDR